MSWDLNSVNIVGRLTRDPEFSSIASGKQICKFSIASNHGKGDDDVSFFDVVAWEKTAEIVAQYLNKGAQCIVSGRLKQDRYTDKEGRKQARIHIIASSVQFMGAKAVGAAPVAQGRNMIVDRDRPNDPIDFEPLGDDEIPF